MLNLSIGVAVITSASAVPLYLQVARDLKNRIEKGEFSANGAIPSETVLCSDYDVSRATVRKAIQTLIDDDVLDVRHGKGVFVRQAKVTSSLSTFKGFSHFCNINNIELSSNVLVLALIDPPSTVSHYLRLKEGEKTVYLKRIRSIDRIPVMIEHIFLPASRFSFLLDIDMNDASLYSVIERETGLKLEDNCFPSIVLEAGLATEEEKALLGVQGEAAMFILTETVYMSTGSPVHYSKQVMLGDYFKYFFSNKANQLGVNWESLEEREGRK